MAMIEIELKVQLHEATKKGTLGNSTLCLYIYRLKLIQINDVNRQDFFASIFNLTDYF